MKKDEYDGIIVGAGIGGLVCGCYLAKAGMKVLIIEKNKEPGGYCTSLKRGDSTFDTVIHAFQNCGSRNILGRIFSELEIDKEIEFIRQDPSDTIITPEVKINIKNNMAETINNFKSAFPNQVNEIDNFFNLVNNKDFAYIYSKYRFDTFKKVLDDFFTEPKLKTIFGIFLANIGSLPSDTSAIPSFAVLRQFVLFGGYYPRGGMQVLPDMLVSKLKQYGGRLLLGEMVDEILVKNYMVQGVKLRSGKIFWSKCIVSNSDMTYTLMKLLKPESIRNFKELNKKLRTLKTTSSIFIVYLKLNKNLRNIVDFGPGIWYIPSDYAIRNKINFPNQRIMANKTIFCSIASKLDSSMLPKGTDIMRLMINVDFHNQGFWQKYSIPLSAKLILQIKEIIPNIDAYITCIGRATPVTMRNYTLNHRGSMCGWLNSPTQVNDSIARYLPDIDGLFYVGHWLTDRYGNGGVAMVADSGRKVAMLIRRKANLVNF